VDLDWFESHVFIANQGGTGEKVCRAAGISDGIERLGRRTRNSHRK